MEPREALIGAALALVVLTVGVSMLMLVTRLKEARVKRIHPQAMATSIQMASRLENIQPADNYRNLFEAPVLFYALIAIALAVDHTPPWLVSGAWVFVWLRIAHSFIHCTYNRVFHRLAVFAAGFAVLIGLWITFFLTLPR
jgi:hypothetical protein